MRVSALVLSVLVLSSFGAFAAQAQTISGPALAQEQMAQAEQYRLREERKAQGETDELEREQIKQQLMWAHQKPGPLAAEQESQAEAYQAREQAKQQALQVEQARLEAAVRNWSNFGGMIWTTAV
jgi:hypothetical protein